MFDFTSVSQAIADVEAADKSFDSLSSADDAAQAALLNARKTAADTSASKNAGQDALTVKLDALVAAVTSFKSQLIPPSSTSSTPPAV
jgi:hypothetical protein